MCNCSAYSICTIILQSVTLLGVKGRIGFIGSSQCWHVAGAQKTLHLPEAWPHTAFALGLGEQ